MGSDGLQASGFFERLARAAGGIVLPVLFLGPDLEQMKDEQEYYGMDIVGSEGLKPQQLVGSCYHISDALFSDILEGVLKQLRRSGFRVVVAYGHGPSTELFDTLRPQFEERYGLRLFTTWRSVEEDGMGTMPVPMNPRS